MRSLAGRAMEEDEDEDRVLGESAPCPVQLDT